MITMRCVTWRLAWFGVGLAALVACGGGGGGAPARPGAAFATSSDPAGACASFTRALCSYLMQCQSVPYCSPAHCMSENTCDGFARLEQALDAGAVIYDSDKGSACLSRFASDPCHAGTLPLAPDVFDVLAQCPGALTPQLQAGDACVSSLECRAGLTCRGAGRGCPGVCTAFATAGQSCAATSCAVGSTCNAQNVCQADGAVGSRCAAYADCGPTSLDLWCDSTTGRCARGVAEGSPCGATSAGLTACAPGLRCDAVGSDGQGTCRSPGPALPPADVGGACELFSDCVVGLVCDGGTCAQPFDVGLRCRSDSYCKKGLTCATEKCLLASCPGDACSEGTSACVLSVCKNGKCQDRAKVGEPCVVGGDCTTGACVTGRCADASVCAPP
jgi:hypothetical protein